MKLLNKLVENVVTNKSPDDRIGKYLISQGFKYCKNDSTDTSAHFVRRARDPYEEMHEVAIIHYSNNKKPTLELHEVHTHLTEPDEDPVHLLKMHLEKLGK